MDPADGELPPELFAEPTATVENVQFSASALQPSALINEYPIAEASTSDVPAMDPAVGELQPVLSAEPTATAEGVQFYIQYPIAEASTSDALAGCPAVGELRPVLSAEPTATAEGVQFYVQYPIPEASTSGALAGDPAVGEQRPVLSAEPTATAEGVPIYVQYSIAEVCTSSAPATDPVVGELRPVLFAEPTDNPETIIFYIPALQPSPLITEYSIAAASTSSVPAMDPVGVGELQPLLLAEPTTTVEGVQFSASALQPSALITEVQQSSAPKSNDADEMIQNKSVKKKINAGKHRKSKGVNKKAKIIQHEKPSAVVSNTPRKSHLKKKEKKSIMAWINNDDDLPGEEEVNDVVTMGGVDLAEESQNLLKSEQIETRSCNNEMAPMDRLHTRITKICHKHGMVEPGLEIARYMNLALHEFCKNNTEKLAVIARHRRAQDMSLDDYEITQNVKDQLEFLKSVDFVMKERRVDAGGDATHQGFKDDDPNQIDFITEDNEAKEMQAELEEIRMKKTNKTAIQAIGSRKKLKKNPSAGDAGNSTAGPSTEAGPSTSGTSADPSASRPTLRITMRDMLFFLENEPRYAHSMILYRAYMKEARKRSEESK